MREVKSQTMKTPELNSDTPVFVERRFPTHDGIELVADIGGDPEAVPVVLLHGGGQTRHSWKNAAGALVDAGYHVINLDLRGHGDSGWSPQGVYTGAVFVADVRTVLAALPRPAILVGASLGGMVSLAAQGGAKDDFAAALVLVDIAPKVEPEGVQQIVQFMAMTRDGFDSLEAAADAIAHYLPHRPKPQQLDGLRKNLNLGPDGRFRWHWDPEFVTGAQRPRAEDVQQQLQAAARTLRIPTLLVRGAKSHLVSDDSVADMRALVPHAEFVDVLGAHHMVAGDENDAFNQAVIEFLLRCAPPHAGAGQ